MEGPTRLDREEIDEEIGSVELTVFRTRRVENLHRDSFIPAKNRHDLRLRFRLCKSSTRKEIAPRISLSRISTRVSTEAESMFASMFVSERQGRILVEERERSQLCRAENWANFRGCAWPDSQRKNRGKVRVFRQRSRRDFSAASS